MLGFERITFEPQSMGGRPTEELLGANPRSGK